MFSKISPLLILFLISFVTYGQLTITPPTRAFSKDGGGGAIITGGADDWTASTDADWITITPETSGEATQVVVYVVDANLTANPRQGVINVNDKTHTVSQTGYATTLSPSTHQHDLYGGSYSFDVITSAGVYWTAATEADWITVSNGSGYGGGTVTYTVAPYGGVATRTGEIQVGSSAYMVQQTGADVNISPTSVYKEYSSDVILVDVSALSSTTWTPTTQQSWISIASPGSGQGDSMIAVAIGTNPSYEEREGSVEIGSISLNIRQAGNPLPALNLVPTEASAEPVGAYGNIAVLATPDAPWVAQSLSSWITLTDTEGSGNGNIGYVASPNPLLEPRVGSVRVSAPYVPPMVDLTTSLQAMFQDGSDFDYSGWKRHRVGPDGVLNGGDYWTLQGQAIQASTDELTIFADFFFVNTGAIHRIFGVNEHGFNVGLYINADNKLVFQSNDQIVISDITFTNNQYYDVAATVAADGSVKLYAAEDGTDAVLVGSSSFSTPVYLMTESTPANSFKIGAGDQPNTGVINEAEIVDFRLYARSLRQQDVEALFLATPSEPYGTPEVTPVTPVASYDLRGSGAAKVWGHDDTTNGYKIYRNISSFSNESAITNRSISWDNMNEGNVNHSIIRSLKISDLRLRAHYASGSYSQRHYPWIHLTIVEHLRDNSNITTEFTFENKDNTAQQSTYLEIDGFSHTLSKECQRLEVFFQFDNTANADSHWRHSLHNEGSIYLDYENPDTTQRFNGFASIFDYINDAYLDRLSLEGPGLASEANGSMGNFEHNNFTLINDTEFYSSKDASHTFWIKLDELPAEETLIYERSPFILSNMKGVRATLMPNGEIRIYEILNNTSNLLSIVDAKLEPSIWYMLGFVGEHNQAFITYINGEEFNSNSTFENTIFGEVDDNDNTWTYFNLGGWNGNAAQLDFYDGILTSSDMRDLYNHQKPNFVDHVVTQGNVSPALSSDSGTIAANGGSLSVDLILSGVANWTATSSDDWLQINSGLNGIGSTTLEVYANENPSVGSRTAIVTIAGIDYTVTQEGQPATVTADSNLFSTDGGSIYVNVDSGASALWEAVSNAPSWLVIALGQSGQGSGQVMVVASPFTQTTQSRTGSITVGDEEIYFTQRGYALSVDPLVAEVGSNAGAGQVGITAPIGAVWQAIVSEPWITITGNTTGFGDGTLNYTLDANNTGAVRSGRIIISGQEYVINQQNSLLLETSSGIGGSITAGTTFETNETAEVSAVAESGYEFSHWTGDAVGSENPLSLIMDSSKSVQAHFIPSGAAAKIGNDYAISQNLVSVDSVLNNPSQYNLYSLDSIRQLSVDIPLIEIDEVSNEVNITLDLMQSADLVNWSNIVLDESMLDTANGNLILKLPVVDNNSLYKFNFSN